jgi:hypothetical protein
MSAKAVATEAQIRRAIKAAQKEGLSIAGLRADGTIIVGKPSPPMVPSADDAKWTDPTKWTIDNVEKKK